MAYQAPRKKKEWWENVLDFVGETADKVIPGDQSSWRSPSTRAEQVAPVVRNQPQQPTLQVQQDSGANRVLRVGQAQPSDILDMGTTKPQALTAPVKPVFDERAVNERLDKGYSWEDIARETKQDVSKVKEFSQRTRPNYGLAPKDYGLAPKDLRQYTDYRMDKTGNKQILGVDVGQFMGDYGDENKMTVGQKTTNITEQDFLKGFDAISQENAKFNTGKQTRDMYVNKLRELAEKGDENAKFTLQTLEKNGKLKGTKTDVIASANEEFLGGLTRSGARAIELLPGEQGTGKWADQDERLNKGSTEMDKIGEGIGQAERLAFDIGTAITPAGSVDKFVKGTRFVQGLSQGNRASKIAGYGARIIPGSTVYAGTDIGSQYLQGDDPNVAQSAAIGVGVDLALPVAGRVLSKIPGVKQAGGAIVDGAGNVIRKGGEFVDAAKTTGAEVAGKIRNGVDDMIDAANERYVAANPGTGFIPSRVYRESRQAAPENNPVEMLSASARNSLANDTTGMKPGGVERSGGFVENGTARPVEVRTLENGEQVIVDGRHTLEYARQNGITDYPIKDVTDQYNAPEPEMPRPMTEWADEYNGVDPRLETAPTVRPVNNMDLGTDARARFGNRAPVKEAPLHEKYGVKPETADRLVRDYGAERAEGALRYMVEAGSSVRNRDAFTVAQAKKMFGPVAPPAGKVTIKNAPEARTMSDEELAAMEASQFGTPTVKVTDASDAEERLIANKLADEQRRSQPNYLTDQQERELAQMTQPPKGTVRIGNGADAVEVPVELATPPTQSMPEPTVTNVSNPSPTRTPEFNSLGKMAETFYDSKAGNQKIKFRDIENLGQRISKEIDNQFKAIGSDFSRVARTVEEARRSGAKSVDGVLTPDEATLWRAAEAEMDYVRRRASLGKREVSTGDFGEMYFPNQSKDAYPTRDSLFEGFRATKPGNENKRTGAIELDELSYSPDVIGGYVTRYADTKLLQEERIYRAMQKNNPDLPEEQVREAAQKLIDVQNRVNKLSTKVQLGVKKVTLSNGKRIEFADELSQIGKSLDKPQIEINQTPRGLTNGDRLNSVDVDDNGKVTKLSDYLGMNQLRDASAYAGRQTQMVGSNREALAGAVEERLKTAYHLPEDDITYAVESIKRMKADLPESVVRARVEGIYRTAAKQQMLEQLQKVNITNKTVKKDVSDLAAQIVREGSIEQELSAKIVSGTLRTTNALFRKLNVSSALNELSDLTSFVTVYGKNTKLLNPDFKLVKEMGLGELDPAIEPYIKAIDNGADPKSVLSKINDGTRLYKFVEHYKAAVQLKTARDFYSSKAGGSLQGDALTAKMLEDYRQLALPQDAFTKTFLNDYPLFTQYMSWGARNIQKEGRLLTGQIDAGIMKDKSVAGRIARDVYANIPAKTAFWLASNGLKGTTLMTAIGLTDFTGLTNQDYSGIAEEDKSLFDKTTQFTNISTIASLVNTSIQALEKEGLKEKYKDADYNPYENANFTDSFINTYTPQFWKNASGAMGLQDKGYSENAGKRVQYEAPDDAWNTFKSFVFGKNQTSNAREYSGRENIVDRIAEGKNPLEAVSDMAQEQIGIKDADYNRPLTDDYSEKYKAVEEGARTALLEGGRAYNNYLDDMKKNSPDLYNNYISAMDGNHVNPEYWRNIGGGTEGGGNLDTFHMMRDRKRQLQKDLGTPYDPLYELPDDQARAVLNYKATPTGDDISVRNNLNKEQWYKDLKARQKEFYAANPTEETDSNFTTTERVKQWDTLDDQLNSMFYDKEEIATNGAPQWANDFPLVFEQKRINDTFGFGSPESDGFFKANAEAYKAQKEGYDRTQLNIINEMRKIEGVPPMSWEGYQQATKVADTDPSDDKSKYGYGSSGSSSTKSSISPEAGGSYSSTGASSAAKVVKINAPKVTLKKRGPAKKIAIKRGGKI